MQLGGKVQPQGMRLVMLLYYEDWLSTYLGT